MPSELQPFLNDYISAIHENQAALFIGAGMSSGYGTWKDLLQSCATQLGLDINREDDLVTLAQYYVNRSGGRVKLNQILKSHFERDAATTENHQLITSLPIATIWTTNYDCLLEKALKEANRTVDVKRHDHDLSQATKGREVILYKMHGDISDPGRTVLCKDDYERYPATHHAFLNALEADLIGKTFLFLGFSFSDPNLRQMLGHLREIFKGPRRQHYAIIRRVRRDFSGMQAKLDRERRFSHDQAKQMLMIEDLARYNVKTIMIDEYTEIGEILHTLNKGHQRKSVFVSGSADRPDVFSENRLRDLCIMLGRQLIAEEFKLVSGLGLNVGSHVVNGALVQLYNSGRSSLEPRISLRPFPRSLPPDIDEKMFCDRYRRDSMQPCGFVIFVAGRSRHHDVSVGVMQEYEIARAWNRICIPVGATGCAAREIWKRLRPHIKRHYHGKVSVEEFDALNDPGMTNERIVGAVIRILRRVSDLENLSSPALAAAGNADGRTPRRSAAIQRTEVRRRKRTELR